MIQIKNKKMCSGCSACANICPQNCISMVADDEGFLYPKIDTEKCTNCGLCSKICPILNKIDDSLQKPKCFACYNKDKEIQLKSSSGGVFSLIAEYILSLGGVVYGAAFESAYKVCHIRIDKIEDLDKLRRSKYIQSGIRFSYQKVKEDLLNNKLVLFTGTGCQVVGLKSYLGKEYDNLYTQDLICHGVPSQKVWEKYLKENKIDENSVVNFREKSKGWTSYCVSIKHSNTEFLKEHRNEVFMKSFLSNSNLRPSCYDCKFKKMHRDADITLADFWGVKRVHPEMDLKNGTSAIMIHSEKGKLLFDSIKESLNFVDTTIDNIVKGNPMYFYSVKPHKNREKFFKNLHKKRLKVLVKKYTETSLILKVARKGKSFVKRILRRK